MASPKLEAAQVASAAIDSVEIPHSDVKMMPKVAEYAFHHNIEYGIAREADTPSYLNNDRFSDRTLKFGNEEVRVHKLILCAGSRYFEKLCTGGFQETHETTIELLAMIRKQSMPYYDTFTDCRTKILPGRTIYFHLCVPTLWQTNTQTGTGTSTVSISAAQSSKTLASFYGVSVGSINELSSRR